jgi:hypothetical protein
VKKWYSNNINNTKLHVVKGHKAKLLGASLTEQASRDMLSYPELEQLGFIVRILILGLCVEILFPTYTEHMHSVSQLTTNCMEQFLRS